jgi:hypothetical protein
MRIEPPDVTEVASMMGFVLSMLFLLAIVVT